MNVLKYSVLAACLSACRPTDDGRLVRIESKLTQLDSVTRGLGAMVFMQSTTTRYILSDVNRNLKTVGSLDVPTAIVAGDRVFLGDDIWDVKYIKVFASRGDSTQASTVSYVNLLVAYGGKATDPKRN